MCIRDRYKGAELLQQEIMDFQTHLYELGELEQHLQDIGFTSITAVSYTHLDVYKRQV